MGKGKWKGKIIMKQRLVPWDKKRKKINGAPQHMTKRQRVRSQAEINEERWTRHSWSYNLQLPGRASLGEPLRDQYKLREKIKNKTGKIYFLFATK